MSDLKEEILTTIRAQKGVLFAKPAIVYRETYSGRDIIAMNSRFEEGYVDDRGYVPVEWWVMSVVEAENPIKKSGEGFTKIKLVSGKEITLRDIGELAEKEVFGKYAKEWPLTKILDIGGDQKPTSFSKNLEVPPIPAHVHSGEIVEGKAIGPGKLEAYFFPPLDVAPYNKQMGKTISRFGFKQGVTKEKFKSLLINFGKDDSMYTLLKPYEIKPYSGWTILAATIHSPGPWVSFEIQLPQDDFNLASWRLGERFETEKDRMEAYQNLCLRGLKDEDDFVNQVVNWEVSSDPDFEKNYFRPIRILESGSWGRKYRIFFDRFYGEGLELEPGESHTFREKDRPVGGIVWSGSGRLNSTEISTNGSGNREFLIVPNTQIELKNDGESILIVFTFEPIKKDDSKVL